MAAQSIEQNQRSRYSTGTNLNLTFSPVCAGFLEATASSLDAAFANRPYHIPYQKYHTKEDRGSSPILRRIALRGKR